MSSKILLLFAFEKFFYTEIHRYTLHILSQKKILASF